MVLVDRMVLLLIDMAPQKCVSEANLLLVMSVLNKRYNLQFDKRLDQFDRSLRGLVFLYLERGPEGLKLGDGGVAEVERMQRTQAPFCRKLKEQASSLYERKPIPRSHHHAHAGFHLHQRAVPTQVRNACQG